MPSVHDRPIDLTRTDTPFLTGLQRARLRESLEVSWQERVRDVVDLAVAQHDTQAAHPGDSARLTAIDTALSTARRDLVDIEAALKRVRSRTYGSCDGCDRRIPFEQLELTPSARFCRTCSPPR